MKKSKKNLKKQRPGLWGRLQQWPAAGLGVEARPLGSGQTPNMEIFFFLVYFIYLFVYNFLYVNLLCKVVEPAFPLKLSIENKQSPGFPLTLYPKVRE
jgi:hypothetical protein